MDYRCFQSPEDLPTYGEFLLRDLQPGMGAAIGTAMRRTLLSSVPGAAPVWMRIGGVCHEFSTVSGVKEDVSQLLLGLRKLVLRVCDRSLHKMTLSVRGRNAVAGDFVTGGAVEILNPQLPIATIGPEGALELEVWVRWGRDHDNAPPEAWDNAFGMIPIDPIFTPVERVAVEVEEELRADHLRLRVWTNGAVSPRSAVDWTGRILQGLLEGLEALKYHDSGQEILARGIEGMALEALGLSNRSYNRLKRAHFDTLEEVLARSWEELCDLPALGPKTVQELMEKLRARGLHLRRDAKAG